MPFKRDVESKAFVMPSMQVSNDADGSGTTGGLFPSVAPAILAEQAAILPRLVITPASLDDGESSSVEDDLNCYEELDMSLKVTFLPFPWNANQV